LTAFSEQLSKQSKAPQLPLDNWSTAFQLLASQLPSKGTVVVLFDEISWMGIGEPDFAGYLKNAWDGLFSRRDRTVVVLCGSVSSWIEENILNNTGFVGRCSWQFQLTPPPADLDRFEVLFTLAQLRAHSPPRSLHDGRIGLARSFARFAPRAESQNRIDRFENRIPAGRLSICSVLDTRRAIGCNTIEDCLG
jgi:hypothetical protein